ncbi:MAG: hypothetical protein GY820_47675 [Gammaproteobacteria bacterium]|nr:hypothetical protein [Gammaproteobacteria bacterium]
MKFNIIILVTILLAACAGTNPLQQANIETNVVYRFTNPTLSTSLYVKLLPTGGKIGELLFKTAMNEDHVYRLAMGELNVLHQKGYHVSERGKISFRFFEEGLFESLLAHHQYASSGGQDDNISMFRYRLDFRKAEKIQ